MVHLYFQGVFFSAAIELARHLLKHSHTHSMESLLCFLGSSAQGLNKTSRYHTFHNRTMPVSGSLQIAGYASSDLEEIENQKERAHSQ